MKKFYFTLISTTYICFLGAYTAFSSSPDSPTPPKAWVGASILDVPQHQVPQAFLPVSPQGVVQIQEVFPSSSAELAGLQQGDYILQVNTLPLQGRKTLLKELSGLLAGDKISFEIGRNGTKSTIKMALSPRPEDIAQITRTLLGSPAPTFEGNWYANTPTSKTIPAKGKVTILDFWATWCGPCRQMLPTMKEIHAKYKDKDVEIIGISSESLSHLQQFQQNQQAPYALFNDISGSLMSAYSAYAFPTLVYIDKNGIIQRMESGARSLSTIERNIEELM